MQAGKNSVLEMGKLFQDTLKKETHTKEEIALLQYVSDFIEFRLKAVSGENFLTQKLELKERQLLKYFSEDEIRALNLSVLYRDVKKETVRSKPELKKLKREVNKKAP